MKPVKIKAYGFLPLSKSVFLGIQAFCFSILGTALVYLVLTPPIKGQRVVIDPMLHGRKSHDPDFFRNLPFIKIENAPWFVLGGIALGVVETGLMLRKFRQKEDELRK